MEVICRWSVLPGCFCVFLCSVLKSVKTDSWKLLHQIYAGLRTAQKFKERGDRACVCFMCGIIPDERHSVRGQRSLVFFNYFSLCHLYVILC